MNTLTLHDILHLDNYCSPPGNSIPRITPEEAALSNEYWTFWGIEESAYVPTETPGVVRLRYHLGQLCMIDRMAELAQYGCPVRAIVCDMPHLMEASDARDRYRESLEITQRFLHVLLDSSNVDVHNMSTFINGHSPHSDNGAAHEGFQAFDTLRSAVNSHNFPAHREFDLAEFRELSIPDLMYVATTLRPFTETLKRYSIPSHILLSAVFACRRNETAQTPFLERFWARDGYAFWSAWPQSRPSWAGPAVTVLEGRRSSYIWLFLECLRAMSSVDSPRSTDSQWPSLCFLRSMPSVNGDSYMTLDRPDGCLFVDSPLDLIRRQVYAAPIAVRREYERRWAHLNTDPRTDAWVESFVSKWEGIQHRLRAADLLRHSPGSSAVANREVKHTYGATTVLAPLCMIVASSLILLSAGALLHYGLGSHLWSGVVPVLTFVLIVAVIVLTLSGLLPAQRLYDLACGWVRKIWPR